MSDEFKTTGAEILAFYKEWPPGKDFYHDDGYLSEDEDGVVTGVEPEDTFNEDDLREALGYLAWQGRGKVPSHVMVKGTKVRIPRDWTGPDLFEVFKAWRGDKVTVSVVMEPGDVEEFKALCAEHGWVVA